MPITVSDIPLTLISFAPEDLSSEVKLRLTKLGHRVNSVKTNHQLDTCSGDFIGITVLLFDRSSLSKDRIRTVLSKASKTPRLGIFSTQELDWDSEIVDLCSEFSSWPCSDRELSMRLQRLFENNTVIIEETRKSETLDELIELNMVGRSSVFLSTVRRIKKFSQCDASVLIEGETGTGKELLARAIHYLSARRDYPFIPVNCGAIPDGLLENELFGHEKGAYTNANANYTGVIAQAEGGTLFLDEIETLSPKGQVALLRFLQEQEYRPLGSRQSHKANVRIVAACNAALSDLVQKGTFRQDLQFRLNIMPVIVPPLRNRTGDAELLAQHFLETFRRQYAKPNKRFHPKSLSFIRHHNWPGNVREVENLVHREFLLAEGPEILFEFLREVGVDKSSIEEQVAQGKLVGCCFSEAKSQAIEAFEKHYLVQLMQEFRGNVTRAAQHAGKERRALGKLLKKYGIDRDRFS